MNKKFDITAFGEILIDYTPLPNSENNMKVFEQNAGGAPANVVVCATKFGSNTAFLGKIGMDMQGEFLKQTLLNNNININGLVEDEEYFTTLAFVSLTNQGEREFSFARKHSADINISKKEINTNILDDTRIFHFGSLSLTHEKCREATIFGIEYAKNNGCLISYDPNYRKLLWDSEEVAIKNMKSVLKYVDILKISDEEVELITGQKDLNKAVDSLLDLGIRIVAITLGKEGALIGTKEGHIFVKGYKPKKVVDTTGAGDSFWGAILHNISKYIKSSNINQITLEELKDFAKFANATASICISRRGAINAMPDLKEVLKLKN